MRLLRITALVTFALASPLLAFARLEFDNPHIRIKAQSGAASQNGVFKFTNTSDTVVRINGIKTSCGCTTTALDKKEYLPGERGEIEAILDIGQRVGKQVKRIQVFTDDAQEPLHNLTFEVEIPQILRINPRLLYWQRNAEPQAKSLTVEILTEEPLKVTGVESSVGGFAFKIEEVEAGRKYKVTATPASTSEMARGKLAIKIDLPSDMQREFFAYLRVQ